MLNETGTLLISENYAQVVAERPGYALAEATMLRYQHPILGDCLVRVLEAKFSHGREVAYYNLLGETIRIPFDYLAAELAAKRLAPFRWSEYRIPDAAQPWLEDIFARWDALQGQKPAEARVGSATIKIWVTDYPVVDGTKADFWAWVTLTSKDLPWYNPEFHSASSLVGWGARNRVVAIREEDGQEVDLTVRFAPEAETYQGRPQTEYGDYFGKSRRVAPPARPLKKSVPALAVAHC